MKNREQITRNKPEPSRRNIIRLGGLAILLGMLIHIILNSVLKVMPPQNPTLTDLEEYLLNESGNWAIVHGFRYLAFTCIVLYVGGLFTKTCSNQKPTTLGWGIIGILGTALFVTNGIITNGIELYAIHGLKFSTTTDPFLQLFHLTRVLFTAELVLWSILILGFSMAGFYSRTLPRWISILGFINVIAGLLTGIFIVVVIKEGWASIFADLASLSGLVWFTCTGVFMIIRGDL